MRWSTGFGRAGQARAEAIDVILAVWERNPPYDIDFPDNRFKVGFAHTAALKLGVDPVATAKTLESQSGAMNDRVSFFRIEQSAQRVLAETWGEPQGDAFRVPVRRCGNVLVLLQPDWFRGLLSLVPSGRLRTFASNAVENIQKLKPFRV